MTWKMAGKKWFVYRDILDTDKFSSPSMEETLSIITKGKRCGSTSSTLRTSNSVSSGKTNDFLFLAAGSFFFNFFTFLEQLGKFSSELSI